MKNSILILTILISVLLSCNKDKKSNQDNPDIKKNIVEQKIDPIDFKDITGKWLLKYEENLRI